MLRIAKEALTFDDVLLVPAHSTVLPNTADLSTQLTKTYSSEYPYAFRSNGYRNGSAPGYCSGSGRRYRLYPQNMSIERQAEEVRRVKKPRIWRGNRSADRTANHDAA